MIPLELFIGLSINDGIAVTLDAISEWAMLQQTDNSLTLQRDEVIDNFHERMNRRRIDESRSRLKYGPLKHDDTEIKKRSQILATYLAQKTSPTEALDWLEDLLAEWVMQCDWDLLTSFVHSQYPTDESWTEQLHSEFVLYQLAELTEH
jgi:hypothetical protein